MNKYLFLLVALLEALAVVAMLFFAATASKNGLVFLGVAVLFALTGAFWVYLFLRARKTL